MCYFTLNKRIRILSNVCGGDLKYRNHIMNGLPFVFPIVVFGDQLKNKMISTLNIKNHHIVVENARVDLNRIQKQNNIVDSFNLKASYRERLKHTKS